MLLDQDFANTLSLFTFPCEVVGLGLATIEVRFPETAARISAWIRNEWDELLLDFGTGDLPPRRVFGLPLPRYNLSMNAWVRRKPLWGAAFYWVLLASAAPLGALIGTWRSPERTLADYHLLVELATGAGMATVALLVAGILWFSVAFVRDREVGSLGIVIAAIGVLGEAYQFAVQLLL